MAGGRLPLRAIKDGPIADEPFLLVDTRPFDGGPGALGDFLARADAAVAYIDAADLERETASGRHDALGRTLALRRYDALITGRPATGDPEARLRRLLGPSAPPVFPVPMAARGIPEPMAGRPVPGLEGGRLLLLAGLGEAQAHADLFLSALGQVEDRRDPPFVGVIVGRDALPGKRRPAPSALPAHTAVHRIAEPAPEEWAWLLDQAAAVVVPAATPDHAVAAAEAAARGRHPILLGPREAWEAAGVAGLDAPASVTDAAGLAAGLRAALDAVRPTEPAPVAVPDGMEGTADALAAVIERIRRRPAARAAGNDAAPQELDLVAGLGSDPAIDALVGEIERGLPDTVRLTVYTPDGEAHGALRPTTRVRPFSAYAAVGRHGRVLCAMGAAAPPDAVVDFAMAVRPSLLLRDGYMLDYWRGRLGKPSLTTFIDRVCGRKVDRPSIDAWEHHSMPVARSFLEPVAEGAPRILVHGADIARRLSAELRRPVAGLPAPPAHRIEDEELTPAFVAATRARLGVPPGRTLIVSFAPPSHLTALEECLWALHMLRHWGLPVQWHIAAPCTPEIHSSIHHTALRLGLSGMIVHHRDAPEPEVVRQYLVAADVGLQLSKVAFGRFAGALVDCVAAGVPTVANAELADAADAPQDAVLRVSDMLSSLEVALALRRLVEAGRPGDRAGRRRAYAAERTTPAYIHSLLSHMAWVR